MCLKCPLKLQIIYLKIKLINKYYNVSKMSFKIIDYLFKNYAKLINKYYNVFIMSLKIKKM